VLGACTGSNPRAQRSLPRLEPNRAVPRASRICFSSAVQAETSASRLLPPCRTRTGTEKGSHAAVAGKRFWVSALSQRRDCKEVEHKPARSHCSRSPLAKGRAVTLLGSGCSFPGQSCCPSAARTRSGSTAGPAAAGPGRGIHPQPSPGTDRRSTRGQAVEYLLNN